MTLFWLQAPSGSSNAPPEPPVANSGALCPIWASWGPIIACKYLIGASQRPIQAFQGPIWAPHGPIWAYQGTIWASQSPFQASHGSFWAYQGPFSAFRGSIWASEGSILGMGTWMGDGWKYEWPEFSTHPPFPGFYSTFSPLWVCYPKSILSSLKYISNQDWWKNPWIHDIYAHGGPLQTIF